jgi:hypothetical protein
MPKDAMKTQIMMEYKTFYTHASDYLRGDLYFNKDFREWMSEEGPKKIY